jgi:hypothetical protein
MASNGPQEALRYSPQQGAVRTSTQQFVRAFFALWNSEVALTILTLALGTMVTELVNWRYF